VKVSGRLKGLPPLLGETPIVAVGGLGWHLHDDTLPSPVAVLRDAALDHNRAWMRRFLAAVGAELAPHAKTTMSPELFRLQLDDGAWGLTVANAHQARVAIDAGARRVLVANEVVTAPERAALAAMAREAEVHALIDGEASAAALAGTGVHALIEVGYPGGRTGCRDLAAAERAAEAAAAVGVPISGIAAYEGLIQGDEPGAREARVRAFVAMVRAVAQALRPRLGPAPLLTAGGTSFPDLVAEGFAVAEGFRPVLRSGCYLTGDHGLYAAALARMATRAPALAGEGLLPALEVWSVVLSRPEPGRAILGAGKRDVGIDAGVPVPLRVVRPGRGVVGGAPGRVVEVNDQHAHLVLAADVDLRVGDRVPLGVTHPCTTFDRWTVLLRAGEDGRVTGAVHTCFG
jgi:D-serine dehydratase